MTSSQTHRIALATDLVVGDRITEIDTPDGEHYTVVKITAKRLTVQTDDLVAVTLGRSPRAQVLVVTA